MRDLAKNIRLPSIDDLFSTEEERQDAKLEKIQILPLSELHPFEGHVTNKSYTGGNIKATVTYGTQRANFYHILEESLNLRDVRIFDTKEDMQGNKIRVLNAAATQEAQMKQQQIEDAFKDWIWKDPTRRQMLVKEYNERFNSLRPREYDGSHILFHGMSPEITLRPHQKNAIAHILYGGNTLLAHVVGAGKTYEMVAAAMEKKRLGLCTKTLICVPNHLTEQLAGEALQLYPNANILVARRTDFEKANRKRFCAKIATGNYDIIVIGHSQFERIPLSQERQVEYLQSQIHDVINQVAQLKEERAENFTVKQMERMRKQLEKKLDKLNDQSRKDNVVTFEQLGVDSLMVDEAHAFKNLAVLSKMRNVAGISQTESQRASDLYMKCRYLDEITGSRGVVFATGTPISNSMAELFTMQRYLQRETLEQHGLSSFDAWASTFGETVTAVELAPEGTGYRTKTRFSKFYNLPELMSMFKQVADVQTADMLNLPVPKLVGGKPINVALPPSPQQKQMVADLADRAEEIRAGNVDPTEDNMLKVTNDGRKLALDQRLIDPNLPENPNDKVHACAENVYRIWSETKDKKLTQLVFCDLSTPKPDGFNVYDDLRNLLISMGIPENEVQFIHSANTEVKKAELFAKVRSGDVRVLMGSTGKMGAGTNVQRLLVATHHLDCGWKPSDIEQRKGHLHNHIVVNSVSFMDGKMFRNDFKTYYQGIRKVSDDLCRQNQLSVIETDGRGISYGEWRNRREGKPTLRGMVKADVEMALAESSDFDDFVGKLQKMGYEVKYGPRVKHMAVRHQDSKRFVRLDGVAPQFSEAELRAFFTQLKKLPPEMQQEYQAENQPVQQSWQKEPELPVVRRVRCRSRLNRPYKKVGGIMACYYHYCALLRRNYRGRSGRRCYYLLREDFSKFNRYRRQCDLLWEQKIESTEELRTYKARLTHELEVLTQKRKYLYNHKEVLTPDVRNRRLEELSARMRTVRRELNTCTDIETDAAALLLKWQEVRQAEKEEREVNENEQRRRSR